MTSELRGVLFHVRERLIRVRMTLLQDEAAAESQPMTVGEAVGYLKDAINLELARPYAARESPIGNACRAERGKQALRCYVEAKGGQLDDTIGQIPELIADLLHLKARIDRDHNSVDNTLRKARAFFERERDKAEQDQDAGSDDESARSRQVKEAAGRISGISKKAK